MTDSVTLAVTFHLDWSRILPCKGEFLLIVAMLHEDKIKEFQQLFKRRFGRDISHTEALEFGTQLIDLVSLIYRPLTKADLSAAKKPIYKSRL